MPRLRYNLDDIEDMPEYELGRWRAKVKSVVRESSKTSGQPMLTWSWAFVDGPNKSRVIKSWTSLQETALIGLKQHLLALGYKGQVDVNTDRLLGKIATLVIGKRAGVREGLPTEFTSVITLLPAKKGRIVDDDEGDEEEDYDGEDEEDDEDEDEEEVAPQRRPARRPARRR